MHLNRLEVRGFKSFRDKIVIEFPDRFMAIIGPNGTGKSNLTEAICFVLGKSRGLRVNNMQELIFNGGKHDKPAKKAVVKIQLSGGNGKHEIARMVDIEGRSIYKLNGKRVTRQKIVDIVGDNEYNIILQDDVTRVIDMQPTERRTLIDDLCGIAEYDKKREKALTELEKVEEKLSDAQIILGEKQGYLNRLKKERDDALQYKEVKQQLEVSKASRLNYEISKFEKRLARYDDKLSDIQKEKDEQQGKIDDINGQIDRSRQELKDVNKSIHKLEEDRLTSKANKLKTEIIRIEERLSSLEEGLIRANNEFGERERVKSELEGEKIQLNDRFGDVSGKLSKVGDGIKKESERVGGEKFLSRLDELRESIYDMHSEITVLGEIKARNSSEIEKLEKERLEIEERLGAAEKTLDEVSDQKQEAEKRLEKGKKDIERRGSELGRMERRLEDAQGLLEKTRLGHERKSAELAAIEKGNFGIRSAEKAVMQLKEVIPGIYGPVSQLGRISDPKFELALTVAAGSRRYNIVVDNVETTQKCIDYLRKKTIGRTTFLPLTKINPRAGGKLPSRAIGFAKDYVKYDKKFEKAFDYVFGDTIVVDNIETARKIGVGDFRMVTIDGDLLERSGAISGGYIKKDVGMVFSNLDDLEKEIKGLSKRIEELSEERDTLKVEREHATGELKGLEEELSGLRADLERLGAGEENTLTRKSELRESLEKNTTMTEKLKNEVSQADEKSEGLNEELSERRASLDDALKKRPAAATTKLDELKDEYRDLEIKESSIRERMNIVDEQLSEICEKLANLDKERKDTKDEIEKLRGELQASNEDLLKLEEGDMDVMGQMKGLFNRRTELDNKILDLSTRLGELKVDLDAINERMSKISVDRVKTEAETEALRKEFRKFEGAELVEKTVKELEGAIYRLDKKLEDFGAINLKAIETYDVMRKEYDEIVEKLETLKNERQSIFDFMDQVEKKKYDTFVKAFDIVKKNFEDIFAKLSGGTGTLILDNPKSISESGLLINASPEGKKIMSLDSMSGGEKVLTSASFLLAIQQYKPSYFYIVDELDAALDKVNSTRLGEMFRDSNAQFVLVTHNDAMIKYAESVVGVSMSNGTSRIVGVKLGQEGSSA